MSKYTKPFRLKSALQVFASSGTRPPSHSKVFWISLGLLILGLCVIALKTRAPQGPSSIDTPLMHVVTQRITPGEAAHAVELHGRTQGGMVTALVAQTPSPLEKIVAPNGGVVKKGDLLMQLSGEARAERLAQMKARVAYHELEVLASKDLVKKSHQSQNHANRLLAELRQAQAEAKAAELEVARTRITAPFEGIFVKGEVEEGTYLSTGKELGHLVSLDPLRVIVFVGEHDYPLLQVGQACDITLATGSKHQGKVVFKSPRSPNKTHTFEVHLEFQNPDNRIPEGVSATVFVSLQHREATPLPASLLTLNDGGLMGVKALTPENKVIFIPLTLLSGNHEQVIVSGLTGATRVITRGQEFVNEGQTVAYEEEPPPVEKAPASVPSTEQPQP